MPAPNNPNYFDDPITAQEAARILGGISSETVHNYRKLGKYRGRFRILSRRTILYCREDIVAHAAACSSRAEFFCE
ncbi:MAG: hypothetical protein HS115_11665 [Spirochaetales bacterium]|nr:hypothetical protein [Spirochaetales bacterium]